MALNDKQIQILVTAKDDASRTLANVGGGLDNLSNSHKSLGQASEGSSMSLGGFLGKVGLIGLAVGGAAKALDFAKDSMGEFVKSAAGIQETEASFEVLLGSGEKAHKLLQDVSVMAAKTPFEFPELASTAQNLLAYGVAVQDILPWLNRLGDLSAGNSEKFKSLALVFGQVKSAGRLMGQDLLQLTSTGIPILDALAKTLHTTKGNVSELVSKGKVDFDTFAKAMSSLSDKGGQFYGLMDKQSTTLNGRMSTLKDTWNQFGRTILGVSQDGTIKAGGMFDRISDATQSSIDWLTKATTVVQKWSGDSVDSSKAVAGSMTLVEIETRNVNRAIDDLHTKQAADAAARKELTLSNKDYAASSHVVADAQTRVNNALAKYGADSPQYIAATDNLTAKQDALNDALFDRVSKTLAVSGADLQLMNAETSLTGATKELTAMQLALNKGLGNIQDTVASFGPTALAQIKPIQNLGLQISNVVAQFHVAVTDIQAQSSAINLRLQGVGSTIDRLQNAANSLQNTTSGIKIQGATGTGLQGAAGTAAVKGVTQARAGGGPVEAGQTYLTGERGMEMFVPKTDGTIIPADQTAKMVGQKTVNQHNTFIVNNQVDPVLIARELSWSLAV